jgi:hypothetical protein
MNHPIAPPTVAVKITIAICFQFFNSPTFSARSPTAFVFVSRLVILALTVSNLPKTLVSRVSIRPSSLVNLRSVFANPASTFLSIASIFLSSPKIRSFNSLMSVSVADVIILVSDLFTSIALLLTVLRSKYPSPSLVGVFRLYGLVGNSYERSTSDFNSPLA